MFSQRRVVYLSFKAQVSTEYLMLFTISITITLGLAIIAYNTYQSILMKNDVYKAVNFLDDVDNIAYSVYLQGNYAAREAFLLLPSDVDGNSFTISSSNILTIETHNSTYAKKISVPINPAFIHNLDHGEGVRLRFYMRNGVVQIKEVAS